MYNTSMSDLSVFAKDIIENNQYMTIASSDELGRPWAAPVAYVYDAEYNFYWVSVPESRHQQNIKKNPDIVISIFDSQQLWGIGAGVQIEATSGEVGLKSVSSVTKLYFSRKYPYKNPCGIFGKGLRTLLKGKVYRFYKAVPNKVWVPDPNAAVDARIEVFLNK